VRLCRPSHSVLHRLDERSNFAFSFRYWLHSCLLQIEASFTTQSPNCSRLRSLSLRRSLLRGVGEAQMRMINRSFLTMLLMFGVGQLNQRTAFAQGSVSPDQLGVVQAPTAGSVQVALALVPLPIRHSAQVAFKALDDGATLTGAQLDKDDVLGLWEIQGQTSDGKGLEADVRPDGMIESWRSRAEPATCQAPYCRR
jgi:hypothetical protein